MYYSSVRACSCSPCRQKTITYLLDSTIIAIAMRMREMRKMRSPTVNVKRTLRMIAAGGFVFLFYFCLFNSQVHMISLTIE